MSPCPSSLPIDVPSLTRLVLALQARNDDLQGRVAFLERQLFGAKSERLATVEPTQGALDLGDLSDAPAAANDDAPARESGRRVSHPPVRRNIGALPRHLPRCERVIEPESLTCPCCSGALHRIGADVSEALDVVPAILRVIRTIRPRYACRHCMSSVVQAPAPSRVMNGSMASTALVSHVVVAKFGWHLPLHRQSQMLASRGVFVDRGTLGHWVERAAWWLKPLHERLLDFIRQQQRVFCDETPLPRLDPGRKRTKICQLWAQAIDDRPWQGPAPPAVGYVFAESRSAREAEAQLRSFSVSAMSAPRIAALERG